MNKTKSIIYLLVLLFSSSAIAQYLDKPYPYRIKVKKSDRIRYNRNNNILQTLRLQTPVKSQGRRGTCSIFSATALLESYLLRKGLNREMIDLSEEWLEYLVMQGQTSDGSYTGKNFHLLKKWGTVREQVWPYDPSAWSLDFGKGQQECGPLTGVNQKSCLFGHRNPALLYASNEQLQDQNGALYDPEFAIIRSKATEFRDRLKASWGQLSRIYSITNENSIKDLLDRNIAVIVDMDFYYGAWNHSSAGKYGLLRDLNNWDKGIVDYPERGSLDRIESQKNRAGHSVVIIGYNDNIAVTYEKKMQNGEVKTFTRKGVYYFKNSWGKDSFGRSMVINGQAAPGYGMVTQDYAHEAGSFYVFQ
jgi:hypothetical protein